jgi:formylglycine-generating enzyme required for sulfatase activity
LDLDQHTPPEPDMVLIPAGHFLMGVDSGCDSDARKEEEPQHQVYLGDYYLARTPVTNGQYAVFVHSTGHKPPPYWSDGELPGTRHRFPVTCVSWYDALAFCEWLAGEMGRPYRLPSEAEWEKGASWEVTALREPAKRRFPWGDGFEAGRCNTKESGIGDTTPVGMYAAGASPYGLLDMAGNVYEWTCSLWGKDMKEPDFPYPYHPGDAREDLRAPRGVMRVLRGGAFYYDANYARTTRRVKSFPDYGVRTRGFRLAGDPSSRL